MYYILALPFGSALAVRLFHEYQQHLDRAQRLPRRILQAAAAWGGCSIVALIVLWVYSDFGMAIGLTFLASLLGYIGPELLTSCRTFMSHPRVFGSILTVGAIVLLMYHQEFLGAIFMIGVILFAFRIMFSPLFKRGGAKK